MAAPLGLPAAAVAVDVTRGAATQLLARRYEHGLTRLRFPHLPDRPRFILCATDLVFGVNWVFDSGIGPRGNGRFGDDQAGYASPAPPWPLARAVAASSCFPPFFSPMPAGLSPTQLKDRDYTGADRQTLAGRIRLTDGGVYDNLGLEPVWKDHLVVTVSDGGGIFKAARDRGLLWRLGRYLAITSNQERELRKRWLISNFVTARMKGTYWGIGSASDHYGVKTPGYSEQLAHDIIAEIRTDLDAFSPAEYAVLENHGYLLAEAAIHAHLAGALPVPASPPALAIPHPDWMDEPDVRRALAGSARHTFWGRT